MIRFPQDLEEAVLQKRWKRFLAECRLKDGTVVTAHCPNSGTMTSCWHENCAAALTRHNDPSRKLEWTLEFTRPGDSWVGVNTFWPNKVTRAAIEAGQVAALREFETIKSEVPYGKNSRIDILLEGKGRRTYVEVKNTTLKDGEVVRFPDAVTERGLKHLKELEACVKEGHRAVMVYFVNRSDVRVMSVADSVDPEYGKALRKAVTKGVEVVALATLRTLKGIEVTGTLPVDLSL